ncbi:hypothetical protein NA78x_005078 [Anatilimnocola sp. NA78]|uniref:hypothetical protein n=1 Tax=Anatilimnocola sp. NA78 TaxID=3415683 RepID=UPI003CE4846A
MADNFFAKPTADALSNPYASPTIYEAQVAPQPGLSAGNTYRDGKRLVVVFPGFSFPARCIKTGRTDELVPKPLTVKHLNNAVIWMLVGGLVGIAIGHALYGRKLEMTLPVSDYYLQSKKKHFRISLMIVLAGAAMFVLSLVAVMLIDPSQQELSNLAAMPMLLGMFTGIGGLIYMAIAGSVNLLTCNRMVGNVAWLDGASVDFLTGLPDWSTSGPVGAPGVVRRS